MGRPRKPAELQALKGNPSKRPLAVAPADVLGPMAAPKHLGSEERKIWNRIAPDLIRAKILRETDRELFALLVDALHDFYQATKQLKAEGLSYESTSPHSPMMRRLNPVYLIKDRSRREAIRIMTMCGMSPVSRTAIFAHLARQAGGPVTDELPGDAKPAEEQRLFEDDGEDQMSPVGALN